MAERDILFAVKNNFYIGAYNNAINEASDMEGLSEAEQTERDVFVYRSYIALGSTDLVLSEIKDSAPMALQAVKLLAQYMGGRIAKEAALEQVSAWVADPICNTNPHVLLVAGLIFASEGNHVEALKACHGGQSLEMLALCVQVYLAMDRPDKAEAQAKAMSAIDDDATVTQLATAWVGVALGGAKVQEASYIYQELGDKFTWTAPLHNGLATCHMKMGEWEDAERDLLEALGRDAKEPDTLANLVTARPRGAAVAVVGAISLLSIWAGRAGGMQPRRARGAAAALPLLLLAAAAGMQPRRARGAAAALPLLLLAAAASRAAAAAGQARACDARAAGIAVGVYGHCPCRCQQEGDAFDCARCPVTCLSYVVECVPGATCAEPPPPVPGVGWGAACAGEVAAGAKCWGRCLPGYAGGGALARCEASGRWVVNPAANLCRPAPTAPAAPAAACAGVPTALARAAPWPAGCRGRAAGGFCSAPCRPGFAGKAFALCTKAGAWSAPVDVCAPEPAAAAGGAAAPPPRRQACGPPPPLAGVAWAPSCAATAAGGSCVGSCVGFGVRGSVVATCGADGAWARPAGACSEVLCKGSPPPVEGAAAWPDCTGWRVGEMCTAAGCAAGFKGGGVFANCMENGSWDNVWGDCTRA
ncbi:coatomer subunit epsilon-1 [Scenedesmus sp. PABB004]|nr:coatomer subunit epsilon-1 [Scenedesmus sp. PABB004]